MVYTSTLLGNQSSINDLPPDILLRIFKYAYVAARRQNAFNFPCREAPCKAEKKCFCNVKPNDRYGWDQKVTRSPVAQFPTSVALVCPHWEEIMLRVPIFWTRIVIHLDADDFSPTKLGLRLCASQDHPIEVVITRTSFLDTEGAKDIEQSRMIEIITALRSHVHRCQILQIEVVHSSSLPRLLALLPPKMPHIQKLVLESHIDSGRPKVQPYSQAEADPTRSIDWGKLDIITIDGWNLVELYSCTPTPNQPIFPKCSSLSIKFGGNGFSSNNIINLIEGCYLESLEVDSVAFTGNGESQHDSTIGSFTLKNLSAEVTAIMLGVCSQIEELTIDNCPSTLILGLPNAPALYLENISLGQGFIGFVGRWGGMYFSVTACPGFDDDVLHLMAMMSEGNDEEDFPLCGLQSLDIIDCHNFTVGGLKNLVDKKYGMLESLMVRKYGSTLPKGDIRWFQKRVSEFSWR